MSALRARAVATLWLRPCQVVGRAPLLRGRPDIRNAGRIEIGDRFCLESRPVRTHLAIHRGGTLRIGDDVGIGQGAAIAAFSSIVIGDRTQIGSFFVAMDTDFHLAGRHGESAGSAPVVIGRDVRIGSRVTVLRGAVVGDGAEIRAGSVVSGSIPARSVASGVPARPLPTFEADTMARIDPSDAAVAEVVRQVFALERPPDPRSGPADIPEWDSLGALRLLIALEEAFGVFLDQDEFVRARSVTDLMIAVASAHLRALAVDEPVT